MSKLRVTVSYRFAIIALCLMISSSLTACKADSNVFATSNASIGGSDGSSSDGAAGFRVRLKAKTGVSGLLHKFGDIATACEITPAEIATGTPTSIQCMLNMMEYDLWFYGFEYEFNVPKSTCEFVTISPNRHYQSEAGQGPVAATMSTTDGTITACNVDGQVIVPAGGFCTASEGKIKPTGEIICQYDYLQRFPDAEGGSPPNCCTGEGTVVLDAGVTDPTSGRVVVTRRAVTTKYGGKTGNCVQSPHDYIDAWPKTVAGNKAADVIFELGTSSLLRSQKIPSTQSLFLSKKRASSHSNFLNAGFHDWAAYAANPATWDTARTIPRAFVPEFDRGPTADHVTLASTVPFVGDGSEQFFCLGGAGEVKYHIRLYTNEWNTIEDYNAYVAGGVASGATPTVSGISGVNCSAINLGTSCNTIWGFEDLLINNAGGLDAYVFPDEFSRASPP